MDESISISGKNVLLVGTSKDSIDFLGSAFREFGSTTTLADDIAGATKSITEGQRYDMVVITVETDVSAVIPYLRELSQNPTRFPILLVCEQLKRDSAEAFIEGADAIFAKSVSIAELKAGVAFSFAESQSSAHRRQERMKVHRARVEFAHPGGKVKGFATNIGLGGMFIGSNEELPSLNTIIKFRVRLENKVEIAGDAVVKWIRSGTKFGRPRGCGVEFQSLDQAMRSKIDALFAEGI